MLVLVETAAGFSLFKVKDALRFENSPNLFEEFSTLQKAHQMIELDKSLLFPNIQEAVTAYIPVKDGKVSKKLGKMLRKAKKAGLDMLLTTNKNLAHSIQKKYDIPCRADSRVATLIRGIRQHLSSFMPELPQSTLEAMQLGLAHSLNRYKFKVNPAKIDVMVVNAIHSLEDLDKEINNYYMRIREMYSWHFPEVGKLVSDNVAFVKLVQRIGRRENAQSVKLDDIVPEELIEPLRHACLSSMGSDFDTEDLEFIQKLCVTVLDSIRVRDKLHDYVRVRMSAIAPNLTDLVGELMGAKLLAHAGTLVNLAKYPASTIQILGAEKALFRALKSRKPTPKYGLIYHASLITQATAEKRGQMARLLACKTALCARCDAFCTGKTLAELEQEAGEGATDGDVKEGEENMDQLRQIGVKFRGYLEWALKQAKESNVNRPLSRPSLPSRGGFGRGGGRGGFGGRQSAPGQFSSANKPYDSGNDWKEFRGEKRPHQGDQNTSQVKNEPSTEKSPAPKKPRVDTDEVKQETETPSKKEKKKRATSESQE